MQRSKLASRRGGQRPVLAACSAALLWSSVGCGSDEVTTPPCVPGVTCVTNVLHVGDPVDITGDGVADGQLVDSNNDGKIDSVDTNGDGFGDVGALDSNGDGVVDSVDTNGDGIGDGPLAPAPADSGDGASDGSDPADGDDGTQPPITVKSAWCDALGVLRTSCQECHSRNVDSTAPMPLDTYDDLMVPSVLDATKKVYEVVSERIHDERRPMPEPPRILSAEDKAIIDAWIAGGAQPGADPTCTSVVEPPPQNNDADGDAGVDQPDPVSADWPEDCEEFYTITVGNGQGHTVAARTEEHPQFYYDAPWGNDPVQALAFKPITDNKKVLHHWILYENGGAASGVGGNFLTGWAPGKDDIRTFPDDIGVYLPSGADALRLDTHYYNLGGDQAEPDNSGVEICITRNFREHTAGTHAFGTVVFSVPPGNKDVKPTCRVSTSGGPAYLLASSPHMHKLGTWAQLWRTRSGNDMMLHDATFSFEFQDAKPLDRVELTTGDTVTTNCRYENDTGATVTFGQDSDDEMCFNFALYYPRGALNCQNTAFFY